MFQSIGKELLMQLQHVSDTLLVRDRRLPDAQVTWLRALPRGGIQPFHSQVQKVHPPNFLNRKYINVVLIIGCIIIFRLSKE